MTHRNIKIGLEIHFQLNTGKLFCRCPVETSGTEKYRFERHLHVSESEMGRIDAAAKYESERSRTFEYVVTDNSCLVECDEDPPKMPNEDAIATAISVARALNCDILDYITYMRKIVIDGSNTSGFQRTAIIGINGYIETSKGKVRISTVCLEEDAARKIEEKEGTVVYSLDRLGIPLIEISTEPDIIDEEHAVEVAKKIGYYVISTGKSRKAPDSVRQDVNFSMGFGRVEIKGVSKLSQIKEVLKYEIQRQDMLKKASDLIKLRGGFDRSRFYFIDVTDLLVNTSSKVVNSGLKTGRAYAALCTNLAGTLKSGEYRLGKELADLVRAYGLKGLLHSDELPGYGLKESDIQPIYDRLQKDELDGVIILLSPQEKIGIIEEEIANRIEKLISLDLSETRGPTEDSTVFLRPMPGKDRMYPETDIPVIAVSKDILQKSDKIKSVGFEDLVSSIITKYGISKQVAESLASDMKIQELEELSTYLDPRESARVLTQIIPYLEKKYAKKFDNNLIFVLVRLMSDRKFDRYQVEKALEILFSENKDPALIVSDERLIELTKDEICEIIDKLKKSGITITKANVVSVLKKNTDRIFDPSMAIECLG
ncbi:hypothetical protein [Thermoplasma volcanium GSS1]|uniref:Glutamyl-tRNA(Gln) amidotransferase subunit E n=1 Tax=Thermoplasma volcanium (strain ATCC 51530 / DSM 4299 / JCM 9571 / NBRC 15438 / GSS1) TaxID=273116 RepID=GATE_THEVO|nr:Glu-tRNA(Gln) amidotransferase subunit GatE [Thermoplasma volcanium]Q979L9.1 RecName: Full=Glutamyl-tRNA(Gln) amidotransferase subunit E; Short=Glu-ADT subunit E [Thermoplasma volcanium GSS1]BAB60283.1 hypothetical protein [Thermoplasma volcanium GSS1]